ncbi:MAG: ATP-binding protein [Putridiphycobacter sp.]
MFAKRGISVLFFIFVRFLSFTQSASDSLQIVEVFTRATQSPNQFDSLTQPAKRILDQNKNNLLIQDTYYFNLAKALFRTAQLDSAILVAKEGQKLFSRQPFHYKIAKYFNVIGSVFAYQQKYEAAINEYKKAIEVFDKNNDRYQAALIKNNIANIFFNLTDFESAYKYSKSSYTDLKELNDTTYLASITGITAISAIELNKLEEGKKLVDECINLSVRYQNVLGQIIGNYAYGEYFLALEKSEMSIDYFKKSLDLSNQYRLLQYSMLNKVGLLIAFESLNQYQEAIIYGEQALEDCKILKNEFMLYALRKHLGRAYYGQGNFKKAFENINEAHEIYKETSSLESKKSVNKMLIQYETEKKEKQLVEQDLIIAKSEVALNKRKIWILALSSLLILMIGVYIYYRKVQHQKLFNLKKETETKQLNALIEGEEKERQRVSNELHDGVASTITAIKIQLENEIQTNGSNHLKKLTEQLTSLHEETRRISHNLMPLNLINTTLVEALKSYCVENSSSSFRINFFENTEDFILDKNKNNVLFRVVQELVNNAQKHSKSNVCFVQVLQENNFIIISVEDEGIGFKPDLVSKSQGLVSIKNRMKTLGGEMEIESTLTKGTIVVLRLPII